MTDSPPPGYYPDPEDPARPRWWDGSQWGPPQHQALEPSEPPRPTDVDVVAAFAYERRTSQLVAMLLLVGIALWIGSAAIRLVTADETRRQYNELITAIQENRTPDTADTGNDNANAFEQLITFGQVAVGVAFGLYLMRAGRVARAVGMPGAWPPAWGLIGIIPVLNLFVPFLYARELVPRDDPARTVINRWYSAWLAMQVGVTITFLVPLFVEVQFSVLAACTVGVAVLIAAAGLEARQMVQAITQRHAAVVAAHLGD